MNRRSFVILLVCFYGIANAQNGASVVEGLNSEGKRWAYEFIEEKTTSKPTITDSLTGWFTYADQDWVIKSSEESGNIGNIKTDIFFYDAKTLDLVAELRVPNVIYKIGRLGSANLFYIATITPAKYRYDDVPLALNLVDPITKNIERIKLIESDYWMALENEVAFEAKNNAVRILVDNNLFSKYVCYRETSQFKGITVSLGTKESGPMSQDSETIAASKKMREDDILANDKAGLSYLGISPTTTHVYSTDTKALNIQNNGYSNIGLVNVENSTELHVIHASRTGTILDINASRLTSTALKLASNAIQCPGIYTNGTLYGVINNKAFFYSNGAVSLAEIPAANIEFTDSQCYSWKFTSINEGVHEFSEGKIFKINQDGAATPLNLNQKLNQIIQDTLKRNNGDIEFDPSNVSLTTYYRGDESVELNNVFNRYDCDTGDAICATTRTGSGKSGFAGAIKGGLSPKEWRIFSVLTAYTTGGPEFSISIENDSINKKLFIADVLPELPDLLIMNTLKGDIAQILYSCGGIIHLIHLDLKTAKSIKVKDWNFPPMEGPPRFCSEKNLLFIPKTSGYDVFEIFDTPEPQKAFEVNFQGNDGYAILLPNGFYAGSPGCENFLRIIGNDGSPLGASALAPWRNRPAEVIKAIGGDMKDADLLSKVTERWLKKIGIDTSMPEPNSSELPKIAVPSIPPLWADQTQVNFTIQITSGSEPLKNVSVRVNGVLVESIKKADLQTHSEGRFSHNGSVKLAQGQNWIEVTAADDKGRVSNTVHFRTILREAPLPVKRYIISMGVSDYDRPELHLLYAAKDAADVVKTLSNLDGIESKVLLLTNKDDSPDALDRVRNFTSGSSESDEVILFCAGHGMLDEKLDYVYAGHNFDPSHPSETGIKLDQLIDAITAGKSLRRLILLDTCQSGFVGEKDEAKLALMASSLPSGVRAIQNRGMKILRASSLSGDDQQRFIEELFLLPGLHRGVNIIGASGGAEYALESSQWNNGVFTSSVIEALRDKQADLNKDGRIFVSDLKSYLAKRVPELTRNAQKPSVVAFEPDQDFDLLGNTAHNNLPSTEVGNNPQTNPLSSGSKFSDSLGLRFVPIPNSQTYICNWDIRVSDYSQFVRESGRAWKPAGFPQESDHPAVRINYNDATAFCDWLTRKEHTSGLLPQGYNYRLPMDLEWSAAAGIDHEIEGQPSYRSGGIRDCYAWGTSWPPPLGSGNYDPKLKTDKFRFTSPVGSFPPNKLGLYDMNGNVYQWIKEDYDETGQGCLRGASWADDDPESINLTNRFPSSKTDNFKCYGFRCVIAPVSQNP